MKTTVEIQDELLRRAQRLAATSGSTLRALIEDGLRLVLEKKAEQPQRFVLADGSAGTAGASNPLERYTWAELRDEIYRSK
jgi:hypothetical protein